MLEEAAWNPKQLHLMQGVLRMRSHYLQSQPGYLDLGKWPWGDYLHRGSGSRGRGDGERFGRKALPTNTPGSTMPLHYNITILYHIILYYWAIGPTGQLKGT